MTETVIVPDDARVIRYSELEALYDQAGSARALAEQIGMVHSTLWRHLRAAGVVRNAVSLAVARG